MTFVRSSQRTERCPEEDREVRQQHCMATRSILNCTRCRRSLSAWDHFSFLVKMKSVRGTAQVESWFLGFPFIFAVSVYSDNASWVSSYPPLLSRQLMRHEFIITHDNHSGQLIINISWH